MVCKQLPCLLERYAVAKRRKRRENRLFVHRRELLHVDVYPVLDSGKLLAQARKPHLGKLLRQVHHFVQTLHAVAEALRESGVEVAVWLQVAYDALKPVLLGGERRPVLVDRQDLRDGARADLEVLAEPTRLEDETHRLLGVGQFPFRSGDGRRRGRRKVEVHGAEAAKLLKGRLPFGRDADEVKVLHRDDHAASSPSGARDFAILPRATAAVCSSPSAIFITRIASRHSGIFTFSKRFTRCDVR